MTAWTLSPTLRPRSSTASLVMEAVTMVPLTSMRTCAVVAPFLMSTMLPGSALRAEILMGHPSGICERCRMAGSIALDLRDNESWQDVSCQLPFARSRRTEMAPAPLAVMTAGRGGGMHFVLRALARSHVERLLGHVVITRATVCERALVATIVIGACRADSGSGERERGFGEHDKSPL